MNERNVFLKIAYDGGAYHGWQIQPNCVTVQGELERGFLKIAGERVSMDSSGRTDSGVHALGQTVTFLTETCIPTAKIPQALNSVLRRDISVLSAHEVKTSFHARFSAVGKTYQYKVYYGKKRNPFLEGYTWHYPYPLDFEKIKRGTKLLLGTHDFKAFQATGSPTKDTIRTIYELELSCDTKQRILGIKVTGSGFLYNMVRIITGTLMHLGSGKLEEKNISEALQTQNRTLLGQTAPPQGLYLEEVFYSEKTRDKKLKKD